MARADLFAHLPRCKADTPQGTMAVANVGRLRPTQNAVGMDEVNEKVARMKQRSDAGLGNDIYRSLSWVARTHYAYEKSPDNAIFAEFRWANFFRTHLVLEQMLGCTKDCTSVTLADLERDDPQAMAKARLRLLYLARSPAARSLPGYLG